jgi:hypothetical protein
MGVFGWLNALCRVLCGVETERGNVLVHTLLGGGEACAIWRQEYFTFGSRDIKMLPCSAAVERAGRKSILVSLVSQGQRTGRQETNLALG